MNQYPKRLIEVDLPIKRISAHARREKSIRHGHISTLHLWWARRPLAACRAVICASLWFDPADEKCPESFRAAVRDEMRRWGRDHRYLMSAASFSHFEAANKDARKYDDEENLRSMLLDFIADFADWDNSTNEAYLRTSQNLTNAAHMANGGETGSRPLVVDPFAGGGSMPLEALRVGADAFASDLNPVAVLLNKVVLDYIPRFGKQLADEVAVWGRWVKEQSEKELAEFYPTDPDGATPIAYIWARTIVCEGPGCGAEIPLMGSTWLVKTGRRSTSLRIIPNLAERRVDFEVVHNAEGAGSGTVKRGSATCPLCAYTTPVTSVRKQLTEKKGGAKTARLICVVTSKATERGRIYRTPTAADLKTVEKATIELNRRMEANEAPLDLIPTETLPLMSGVFNAPIYGHNTWESLFTARQLLALTTLSRYAREAGNKIAETASADLGSAVRAVLAIAVDRIAVRCTAQCIWDATTQCIMQIFNQGQSIPVRFEFAEMTPLTDEGSGWVNTFSYYDKVFKHLDSITRSAHVEQLSATSHSLPDDIAAAFITDPPYYNAVPYADLSDFFYVWLRRTLGPNDFGMFGEELSPKDSEVCEMAGWDPVRYPHKDKAFFEREMGRAMAEGRRLLQPNGIGVVVFANKSTSGWEAQLQAMVDAGWIITGSWAIDTESVNRLRAQGSAALASSIHLVCRPRENQDGSLHDNIGDWRDIIRQLPVRIHEWMPRLAREGVVGADAIFACLGPALEIFSRYSSVQKPSGDEVKLKEYLENVWAAVAKEALNMIFSGADASGFEEDARLSAMWLWTLFAGASSAEASEADRDSGGLEEEETGKTAKTKGYVLESSVAFQLAQGIGATLERLSSVIEVKGEKARLLPVSERARDLFGYVDSSATEKKRKTKAQKKLFEDIEEFDYESTTGIGGAPEAGATTLDRIHQTMLLFGAGRSEAVRRFLVDDGVGNDERFWRLANALSALYPSGTDEKRWVDGVLARKKGLGF